MNPTLLDSPTEPRNRTTGDSARALLDLLWQRLPTGLGVIDAHLRLTRCNDALARAAGLDKTALPLALEAAGLLRGLTEPTQAVLAALRPATGLPIAVPESSAVLRADLYPLPSEEPNQPPDVLMLLDVPAEAADAQTGEHLLARLSHELRTPLTPILSAAAQWAGDPNLPGELRRAMLMIQRNAELEARLIDDLLDYAKIARGRINLIRRLVDVHEVVRLAIDNATPEALDKGVMLGAELGGGHPQVVGDASRLLQVCTHLLGNALRYTPSGGSIRVRSWNEPGDAEREGPGPRPDGADQWLVLEVIDTGVGIEPARLPRIIQEFSHVPQSGIPSAGRVGIGLAVARAVVEAHGGRVRIDSEGPGRGTRVRVDLPCAEPAPGSVVEVRPLRILLVEDHEDTLRVLARLLSSLGHGVHSASTVASALEVSSREQFDLLISDIGLPDGSGHDLMRRLRQLQDLRGIAVSGLGMDADLARSKAAGFDEHLVKPVSVDRLEDAIREVTLGRGDASE